MDHSIPDQYIPPHSIEAEQAVLGCVLIDPHTLKTVREHLTRWDFWREMHGIVFAAFCSLADAGQPIDLTTVAEQLLTGETLDLVGGRLYLVNLMEAPATSANAKHYARIVEEKARLRTGIERAYQFIEMASRGDLNAIVGRNGQFDLGKVVKHGARQASRRAFEMGIIDASDVPTGVPPKRIWFGMYEGCIVLLNGASGAGKSSLLYNIAVHAAQNEPLYGVRWGLGRPLRVLSIDPENAGNWDENERSGGVCGTKLDRVSGADRSVLKPLFLKFHDGRGLDLSSEECVKELTDYIIKHQIDLVILDPLANLFATKDENDNAEASRQMKGLIEVKQRTRVCIMVCHHTGKSEASGSRGASSREGAADVVMTFRARSENEDDVDDDYSDNPPARGDIVRFKITKNRMESSKGSLFLRMVGDDRFERVKFNEWKDLQPEPAKLVNNPINKLYEAKNAVLALLGDGQYRSREQVVSCLKIGINLDNKVVKIGETNTSAALREHVQDGIVLTMKQGQTVLYWMEVGAPKLLNNNDLPKQTLIIKKLDETVKETYDPAAAPMVTDFFDEAEPVEHLVASDPFADEEGNPDA